jgi:nucleoside-diphosphate-sugar epimerase
LSSDNWSVVLDGITSIIHIASPLAHEVGAPVFKQLDGIYKLILFNQSEDYERDIISPAISMVTIVLEAAAKVLSVRRVVITSSCESFERSINK